MPKSLEELNAEILAKLDGQAKEDFKLGLKLLGIKDPEDFEALKQAFIRSGLSPEAAEIAARGK